MADTAIAAPAAGLLTRTRLRMPWLVVLALTWIVLTVLTAIFADRSIFVIS